MVCMCVCVCVEVHSITYRNHFEEDKSLEQQAHFHHNLEHLILFLCLRHIKEKNTREKNMRKKEICFVCVCVCVCVCDRGRETMRKKRETTTTTIPSRPLLKCLIQMNEHIP